MKLCRICFVEKELKFFVKSKVFKSGFDTICLDCSREKVKLWRKAGKRNSAAEAKRYYDRWPGKGRAKVALYRARKLKATPSWANREKIEHIYHHCPNGYHVDHIIPLNGKLVSGLHVEHNLQYLPSKVNIAKGNTWQII